MTRETKVGIVVSCSFLCLVGAVLALKMQRAGEAPTASVPGPIAATDPAPAPTPTDATPLTNGNVTPITIGNTAPPPVANVDTARAPAPSLDDRSRVKGSERRPEQVAVRMPNGTHEPAAKRSDIGPDVIGTKPPPAEIDPFTGLPKIAINFTAPIQSTLEPMATNTAATGTTANTVGATNTLPSVVFDPNRQVAINLGTNSGTDAGSAGTSGGNTDKVPPPPASTSSGGPPMPPAPTPDPTIGSNVNSTGTSGPNLNATVTLPVTGATQVAGQRRPLGSIRRRSKISPSRSKRRQTTNRDRQHRRHPRRLSRLSSVRLRWPPKRHRQI